MSKEVVVTKPKAVVTKEPEQVVVTPDVPHKSKSPILEDKGNQTNEPTQAKTNSTGEKVETPESEVDKVYVTSEGKHMIIHQRDDENGQVFAGEKGQNSKWYRKEVVDSWNELQSQSDTTEDEKPKKAKK